MSGVLDKESVNQILQKAIDENRARLFDSNTQYPNLVQKITLDLTTARLETKPYEIKFPFRSFYVQDATDVNVNVNIKPITMDSFQSFFNIKKNDVWSPDYNIPAAYLHWDAQSGKSITIIFFIDAKFTSGSLINQLSGGVSVIEGTAVTTAVTTLAAATAASVFAADSTRKLGLLQNNSGASIWVGPSTVTTSGATLGLEILAGDTFAWRNTAALYAISVAGGDVLSMSQG